MGLVITGHLGFVGSYLTKHLDGVGIDLKEGNDILTCDLPPADTVIHLAAQPGVIKSMEDPAYTFEQNVQGTIRLLKHYKDARFIFISSGGTIQETIESPYGLSKYTGEELVRMLHDDYVIIRFPNVYGEGSRSVVDKFLAEDELTIYGDGKTYRIYAHVEDVVDAVIRSLYWPKGLYKLGTNQRYSVNEIAKAIGKPIKYAPARRGEITNLDSQLENNTPNWKAKTELMDYINDKRRNSQ